MMSSRRAAALAMWELFAITDKTGEGDRFVFRSYGQMSWTNISRSGYKKRLVRFEKYGLLKKTKTSQGHVFEITAKAKFLRHKAVSKQSRTDGFSTLIIFDIPEDKHNARDTLRRYLIRSGYTQIRESCFLSPFQISQDMKDLIAELKLQSNVSVFSAKMNVL
jgi:DNA-binding transcriptional regulator PaaX